MLIAALDCLLSLMYQDWYQKIEVQAYIGMLGMSCKRRTAFVLAAASAGWLLNSQHMPATQHSRTMWQGSVLDIQCQQVIHIYICMVCEV